MVKIRRGAQVMDIQVPAGTVVARVLEQAGCPVAQPCGGRGVCGKCAVMLQGAFSTPNVQERRLGVRLACQAQVEGDGEIILPQEQEMQSIEQGSSMAVTPLQPMPGAWGAAVDIGTTTLALRLYDMHSGACRGVSTMLNPQTAVAADVIGRMDAALKGRSADLQGQILTALETLLAHACAQAGVTLPQVSSLCITGNTTMLYLLTGRSPESLSHAPFAADDFFGRVEQVLGRSCYLPDCLHAFVGADVSCAILASGMCRKNETALLCDMGTNGEMALWKDGQLYIASTAMGPAFEGAGISCGCGSVRGAIDAVELVNGRLHCHVLGGGEALGLCGSGLIDAVAALLDTGFLEDTGAMDDDAPLKDGVVLTQGDIRAVQLAKAAVAAGMQCLMKAADCTPAQVQTLYLAGGFGSHLNIRHAVRMGLIPPELEGKVRVIGNAALDGAARALMDGSVWQMLQDMAQHARHVELGGSAEFANAYVESMMFPEEDA